MAYALRGALACVVLAAFCFGSVGSAEVINWNDNPTPVTIAEVNEAGGLLVGDKLFSNFVVMTSGTSIVKPNYDTITLAGFLSGADYGLRFQSLWYAAAGQWVDTALVFDVAVLEDSGMLISDNELRMPGSSTVYADVYARVGITESILQLSPSGVEGGLLASERVYDTLNEKVLFDHAEFAGVSSIRVVKDISVIGGLTGAGAELSYFTQTFSQTAIPEPQTIVLLLCGLPGLALMAWRRYRR